jgi:hypothetical protein
MTLGVCDGIFSVSPFICEAHEMVNGLGLALPQLFPKILRMRPSRKVSMALSGEMFFDVLRKLSHRDMYDLKLSPIFYMHRRRSSNDVGRR